MNYDTPLFSTAHSFIDLIQYIFTIPGVKSFLSEKISQDPLEKYFGRQRQRGGVNENPTCKEFLQNNNALRMVNSITIETHKGNVRRTDTSKGNAYTEISTEPLSKRKKTDAMKTPMPNSDHIPVSTQPNTTQCSLLYGTYHVWHIQYSWMHFFH